jgi:UDP:flavonoid glycosyltransferase YjiC (YdhE family)
VKKPAWWDQLPEGRPCVYVSMGSTGQPNLLGTIFSVLGKLLVTVIAATAARWKPHQVPSNVFVADFLPGMEAALRSRLVICNGGAMSGPQALAAGVPYLGLVSNMDQMLFSKAVRSAGACELIREGEVNENNLRQMIQAILTQEKYHAAAGRCAARMADADPCKAFEAFISTIPRATGNLAVSRIRRSAVPMAAAGI